MELDVPKKLYPFKRSNRYYSELSPEPESLLFGTIPSFLRSLFSKARGQGVSVSDWCMPAVLQKTSQDPVITWIGHSTFLIQIGGINILTDPIFGNASCLYRRMLPPGIPLDGLPAIDYVLLSHNHRDHMDSTALHAIKKQHNAQILVPAGDKRWFDRRSFNGVSEYMWWQSYKVAITSMYAPSIKFTFLPAAHWSQRGIFDKNKSLWGSWMIEWGSQTIYFAGDTAYAQHFSFIKDEFPKIDIALMPIGPCEPRDWMARTHTSPQEAGQAFLDLQATHFIPMHWATFAFGFDSFEMPLSLLKTWWQENSAMLADKYLHVPKVGQSLIFPQLQKTVPLSQERIIQL